MPVNRAWGTRGQRIGVRDSGNWLIATREEHFEAAGFCHRQANRTCVNMKNFSSPLALAAGLIALVLVGDIVTPQLL